mgnify:CR=1 FL=1
MEVKINIPDNCELVQEGNTYIVKEKQKPLPKTWGEFCKNYPVEEKEYYISLSRDIQSMSEIGERICSEDRNFCSTKEEAEAFLALMQLRRLRNAWVEDWKPIEGHYSVYITGGDVTVSKFSATRYTLSFPTSDMANEFAECFKDLIMKAKILL